MTLRMPLSDFRLSLPPLPPRHVPRPRLVAALNHATGVPLTLVSAGAGAGKTVLLSEWANHSRDRIVWVTLTAIDVEPTRFWTLLARALRQADALSSVAAGELAGLPGDSFPVTSPGPGRQFVEVPDQVTVIIDGAHLIKDRVDPARP